MDLRDIPTIKASGRLGRRVDSDSDLRDAYSTDRILDADRLGSLAIRAGLESVSLLRDRVFPSARRMSIMQAGFGGNYTFHSSCYNNYSGPCDSPCYGFPPHQMSSFYCATCDEQAADPANNPDWNWHFVGTRFNGGIEYGDIEPDICAGRDAWKWRIEGTCGECESSVVFRCHDGYKRYSDNTMDYTICEGKIACDDKLTLCD